jgi:hypothetical protein
MNSNETKYCLKTENNRKLERILHIDHTRQPVMSEGI